MSTFNEYVVGEVLEPLRKPVEIYPEREYSAIGIRSFGRGLFHYEPIPGDALSKLRYYEFPADALAISNIKGWEGAVARTSTGDIGSVASNRFLFYRPKSQEIDINYVYYYFLSELGLSQIGRASPGSADRNRS